MKQNPHSKPLITRAIFILSIMFSAFSLRAEIKLPRLISNGMVLQRDKPLQIWGWASPSEKVSITFQDKNFQTKADKKGNWKITLPSYSAGGPYKMQINDLELSDILIGEVWLCSGQSNMELPLRRTIDLYKNEVETANNPQIRLFRAPLFYNFKQEEDDLQGGDWKPLTPVNILDFSTVAYFFAKNVYDKFSTPIGIINTAVGGSPAEAWISKEALKNFPEYLEKIAVSSNNAYIDSIQKTESRKAKEWHNLLNQTDKGVSTWNKDNLDVSTWPSISLPGYWADKGVENMNGSIWFRKDFDISESTAGKAATLRLGRIIDADSTFINGIFVGTVSYQYPPRVYSIPANVLRKGKNNIAVRIISKNGMGGFVEEKPYKIITDSEEIDLTGEWKFKIGAPMNPAPPQTFFQYNPSGLFNGLIAPLTKYQVRGFLWYQGESNTGNPSEYKKLMTSLIKEWRVRWNSPEMPFIYAQLPNFMEASKEPQESKWAELREMQRQTLEVPHTGMAVTIDLGEWNDLHPLNKKDVAKRLFMEALRVAYNDSTIVSTGPQYESMTIKDNSIILTFSSVASGLYSNLKLKGFSIAGTDKKFVWANAVFLSDNQIKVWSADVQRPLFVRYAWADNPDDANLSNKEGLPASPFTTE